MLYASTPNCNYFFSLVIKPIEFESGNSWEAAVIFGSGWGVYHFVIEGVACMLLQPGIGQKSVVRGFLMSSAIALYTFILMMFAFKVHSLSALLHGFNLLHF